MIDICLARDILESDKNPLTNPVGDELVLICGNCGHYCSGFHEGYDGESDSLRETYCPNCWTALFSRSLVVASYAYARELTLSDIQHYLYNRADELLWQKSIHDEFLFEGAVIWDDCDLNWQNTCPACATTEPDDGFDFHHWDYENDVGCQLCRGCHEFIHNEKRASEQTEDTGRPWQFEAVSRLVRLSEENELKFSDSRRFIERYNIPSDTLAQEAAFEALLGDER
jgi:hypothetical protein